MSENFPPLTGADRRASPRSPLLIRDAKTFCGMDVFFGYALNVSRTGLFISSTKVRQKGELCQIQFKLPNIPQAFTCQAEVVWSRSYNSKEHLSPGFGLRFLNLPEEDANTINQWVEDSLRGKT